MCLSWIYTQKIECSLLIWTVYIAASLMPASNFHPPATQTIPSSSILVVDLLQKVGKTENFIWHSKKCLHFYF